MFTGFREKKHQRELCRSSLILEGAMEVTKVEVEEDLVAEEEVRSPSKTMDN